MRYSRAERLIQLALEMQAARGGLTIADIMEKFAVSRRTAIRMRDAVIRAFPQADEVPSIDRHKRWRLPQGTAQVFGGITADDLATLEAGAQAFEQANLEVHAENLRSLGAKVRSILKDQEMRQIDPDLEALLEAEGLAHRPGPRPRIPAATFDLLRKAVKSCCKVTFDYSSRQGRESRRTVCPLGFLYGHRHYLVARDEDEVLKFFSLPSISGLKMLNESFTRDPEFDIRSMVSRSFGVFEEEAVNVVWRFNAEAARFAREFVFHESQSLEDQDDGSLIVRFTAGGLVEMAWHLMAWGNSVEVIEPQALRQLMPSTPPNWPVLP